MGYVTLFRSDTGSFTFADGMVENMNIIVSSNIDEQKMPGGGPMSNYGLDIEGVSKTITISGNLFDADSTVLSTTDLRDRRAIKIWLESLQNGNQTPFTLTTDYDSLSSVGSGTFSVVDSITGSSIPCISSLTTTTVYIQTMKFDINYIDEKIPFTIDLMVSGS